MEYFTLTKAAPLDDLRSRLEQQLADTYRIERELGGGGMSRTYLAYEHALSRRVVIKVLAPELLAGISVERFRREVLLAAQLQHPHVVPVLSAGEAEGLPWFTMPYVDGDSLRHLLATGALGVGESISILRDVARALAYAHKQGIVHRDIKPDNVLLSAGSATVTDFGIAKAIAASRTESPALGMTLTQVGTSIGTPTYMSPEQALGDSSTDHRADIYSFGVMAFEMLAGQPPFRADTAHKLVAAHLSEAPRAVSVLRPDCPPMLAELVMHCLAKDPSRRPQQSGDLVRVLESIVSSASQATAPAILRGGNFSATRALALWGGVTAAVALTAWAATSVIGLPDWVMPGAIGVMLAGLPVILFTAYTQRTVRRAYTNARNASDASAVAHGTMATLAIRAAPHLTWRQTWLGGGIAVGAFAALVIGFMVMRASGIGPMATLQGKGAFGERESIVVADFRGPPDDPELGTTLAEALRTDLGQSRAMHVLSRATLRDMLRLMERADESVVNFDLAREIATREGAKAVLDGNVVRVGQQYVVSARLVNAQDGTELVTFRQEAHNEDDLLGAMGRLSRAVRERAGESLRSIRQSGGLERVTTPSLAALRKYVEGSRAYGDHGNSDRAEALLRQAVALDTAFAMAWRRLAVVIMNRGTSKEQELHALETAYRHRDRLTEQERLMTEATYFSFGRHPDLDKALAAYDQLLRIDSTNMVALNNSGSLYISRGDFERAEQLFRLATRAPTSAGNTFTNLLGMQIRNQRSAAALDSTVAALKVRFPEHGNIWIAEVTAAVARGDYAMADSISRGVYERGTTLEERRTSSATLEDIAAIHGRPTEAMEWRARYSGALVRSAPSVANRLEAVLDTAEYAAVHFAHEGQYRAAITHATAPARLDSIPPSERPWVRLLQIAVSARDTSLLRVASAGYTRDVLPLQMDSTAARTRLEAFTMFGAGRYDDAIRLLREVQQRSPFPPEYYHWLVGTAHDQAGRADSAAAYYERFVTEQTPDGYVKAMFAPRVHRRLGELYEDLNNMDKAVEHYNAFVELWKDAEPQLRPEVEEVRARLERIRLRRG